ncbi:MAG: hypothetical protein HQL99_06915 [Magnetococcales bacterium]|nr:hypothetical protein [Magnetococcales bacterium]
MKKSILALTVALGLGLAGTVSSLEAAEKAATKGTASLTMAANDLTTDKHAAQATQAKATKKAKKKTKKKTAAAKTNTVITK